MEDTSRCWSQVWTSGGLGQWGPIRDSLKKWHSSTFKCANREGVLGLGALRIGLQATTGETGCRQVFPIGYDIKFGHMRWTNMQGILTEYTIKQGGMAERGAWPHRGEEQTAHHHIWKRHQPLHQSHDCGNVSNKYRTELTCFRWMSSTADSRADESHQKNEPAVRTNCNNRIRTEQKTTALYPVRFR